MEALGLFVVGIFLLLLGGDSVVKGSSGLSQRVGLSPFAAGALLLTFATSIPVEVFDGDSERGDDGLSESDGACHSVVLAFRSSTSWAVRSGRVWSSQRRRDMPSVNTGHPSTGSRVAPVDEVGGSAGGAVFLVAISCRP